MMFTDGLDPNELEWVRKTSNARPKQQAPDLSGRPKGFPPTPSKSPQGLPRGLSQMSPIDSVDYSNQNSPIPGLPSVPLSKHFIPSYTGTSPRSSVSPLSTLPGNSGGTESCGSTGIRIERQARADADSDSEDDGMSGPAQDRAGRPEQRSRWALDALRNRALWQRRSSLRQEGATQMDGESSPFEVHHERTFEERGGEVSGRSAGRSPVSSVRAYRHSFGPDFPRSRRREADPGREQGGGEPVMRANAAAGDEEWDAGVPDDEEHSPWERPYFLQQPQLAMTESAAGTTQSAVSTPYSDITTVPHSHATSGTPPSMDPPPSGRASSLPSEPPTPGTTRAAPSENGDITNAGGSRSETPEAEDAEAAQSEHPPSAPPMAHYTGEGAAPAGPLAEVPTMPLLARPIHHLHSATWSHSQEPQAPGPTERYHHAMAMAEGAPSPLSRGGPPDAFSYTNGPEAWQAVVTYDAVVRLCLVGSARGCLEAHQFLHDGCDLLRASFGLDQVLLQPAHRRKTVQAAAASGSGQSQPVVGSLKVQVRKVKLGQERTVGQKAAVLTGKVAKASARAGSKYMRQVSGWVQRAKGSEGGASSQTSADTRVPSPGEDVEESPTSASTATQAPLLQLWCRLRLKSMPSEKALKVQPGTGDTFKLAPETPGDDLVLEVVDASGDVKGGVTLPLASMDDTPTNRVRWVQFYGSENGAELVGRVQLSLIYALAGAGSAAAKWQPTTETSAYDILLGVVLRALGFRHRELQLYGPWRWLLDEFALYYGVSDSYTRLRYLTHVMQVATPTKDCFELVHELLAPVLEASADDALTRQERHIFATVEDAVNALLAYTFENYKSLDEDASRGVIEAHMLTPNYQPTSAGSAAPALAPAVQLYALLHDILSVKVQDTLRTHLQTAARKRCQLSDGENGLGETLSELDGAAGYARMRALCMQLGSEVRLDIEIHKQDIFPSSIDLPRISADIYTVELATKLRAFLSLCPPPAPSPPVVDLLHAVADFERDLQERGIQCAPGVGVSAIGLFGDYIEVWIQDTRLQLLELCKGEKPKLVAPSAVSERHGTAPFVEDMYARIKDTLADYERVVTRWPEYAVVLENALCEVERGLLTALERQYAEFLLPVSTGSGPRVAKYVAKLRRKQQPLYVVPHQLGIILSTLKRLLESLRPKVEAQMKHWIVGVPVDGSDGKAAFGDRFAEVTVELRAKYKNTLSAIIEKLAQNAHSERRTHLKKVLQDTKAKGDDIARRMQPLVAQLGDTIKHLDQVLSSRVFVAVCRGYWDRMAKDVLHFLENRKENMSWVKSASAEMALQYLDRVFTHHMTQLQGHSLQERDLDAPRSVLEARSMLSKDMPNVEQSYSLF